MEEEKTEGWILLHDTILLWGSLAFFAICVFVFPVEFVVCVCLCILSTSQLTISRHCVLFFCFGTAFE